MMLRRRLNEVGALGISAVGLYVGATLLGGLLDPGYSHMRNAISELTASDAPNVGVLAPIFVAYNLALVGFAFAVLRASVGGSLFRVAAWLFAAAAVSGIGQVTVFRMDSVGTAATTAGTIHLVLAGVSSIITLASAVLYGVAFRRDGAFRTLSTYSFATAGLLVLSAPAAVISIGTDVMGLFERLTIGVFLAWVVVVSWHVLLAARRLAARPSESGSAAIPA